MRHAGMIPGFGVGVASGSILIASAMSRQDNLWTGPRRKVRFGAGEHPTDAPRHPTTAVLERSAATSRKTRCLAGTAYVRGKYLPLTYVCEGANGRGGKDGLLPQGSRVRARRLEHWTSPARRLPRHLGLSVARD